MASQLEGVRPASESSIEIEFYFHGRLCHERIRLKPSAANLQRASDLRKKILQAIDNGEFNYALAFPQSRNAVSFPK
ncbi:hypothetical protein CR155_19165 [Pollutimonas nitritireducens]|uniref:Min27-like integrase DNA-binding domain-containing protein n=1 Tax=Pollutimonas nitritireducens TaxID=2045209 RepID=A0A2N4UAY1_9BURK|nr:DUF3596 domain-containing protein [Pollutimonas nitritireducens]PLC52169.1 hypothetical protein CR155_19165 [Pollutimonas nitritireducens]